MKGIRLAFALVRLPKLFISLILVPLLISLILVIGQLAATSVFLEVANREIPTSVEEAKSKDKGRLLRKILYGSTEKLQPIKICRWSQKRSVNGGEIFESPPSKDCNPDRLDVALLVNEPEKYDPEYYVKIFDGTIERIHLCQSCHPDIVIDDRGSKISTKISSIWALLVLSQLKLSFVQSDPYIGAMQEAAKLKGAFGTKSLQLPGFRSAVSISDIQNSMAIILNIASLTVITLWLALKAHRKVLDYFTRSGALLPMAAAVGQRTFYSAIWILTLFRVVSFLAAALPITTYVLWNGLSGRSAKSFSGETLSSILLWIIAVAVGFSLATLIASISELKHRHSFLSFVYRYIPLLLCLTGAIIWTSTLIVEGPRIALIRNLTTLLPVVGIGPILMAPAFKPNFDILAFHVLLTSILFTVILKANARWFAAHLEEL